MRNIIMIGAAALLLAGCDTRKPNRVIAEGGEIQRETPTPSPTVAPTPTPLAMTQEVMNKMIQEALAKALPTPSPTPRSTPFAIPEIINPFETEEERAAKAARKGLALTNEKGERWAVLSRDDHEEVTKGLPEELTTILTGENVIPYTIRDADGWKVQWQKFDKSKSSEVTPPAITGSPTPRVPPPADLTVKPPDSSPTPAATPVPSATSGPMSASPAATPSSTPPPAINQTPPA